MTTQSNHHPVQQRAALLMVTALVCLVVISCAPRHTPVLSETANKYHPVRIAADVQAGPGSVAWSLDGKTLAFINGKVNLYDIDLAVQKTIPIIAPHFLSWSEDNRLYVVFQEHGHSALVSMDRKGEDPRQMAVDDGVEAIYPATNTGDVLVLTRDVRSFTYGTGLTLRLSAYGRHDRLTKTLYTLDKTYPWKQPDWRFLLAWTHAGLNPLDNSLLVIEQARPPAFRPFSRVIAVDPVSGEAVELFSKKERTVYTSASWSPDGRSIAVTDGDGRLQIRLANGEWLLPQYEYPGFYPAWNPRGSKIFSGGNVIDLDRNNFESLLTQSAWSIAEWSPDGTMLAVAANGELWLFRGFLTSASSYDAGIDKSLSKKMSLLQELFREGLITPEEYRERRNKLRDLKNRH